MPTLWKVDGFEHGVAASGAAGVYDSTTGTPAIVTSPARTGSRSLEIDANGTAEYVGYTPATGVQTVVASLYIHFVTLPSSDAQLMFAVASGNMYLYYHQSTGRFAVRDTTSGTFVDDTTVTVATGTWYRIDISFDSSSTSYTTKAMVNGGAQFSTTVSGKTIADITAVRIGNSSSQTHTKYYDDLLLSDQSGDYPIGPHSVEALIPNSDGTHNIAASGDFDSFTSTAFSNSTTNGNTFIGHRPLQVANTADQVIRQDVSGTTNYMEFGMENVSDSALPVMGVRAYATHTEAFDTNASLGEARLLLSDDTEVLTTGSISVINSTEDPGVAVRVRSRMTIDPSGGWDGTKVNGLKARVGFGDGNPAVNFIDFMVEVALGVSGGAATFERATALSSTAEIASSGQVSFTGYPYKVQNLVATAVSSTEIDLSWDDVTALGNEAFDIERNGVIVREDYTGTHSPASPYPDVGLDPTTTYTYRVRAVGGIVGGGATHTRQAALSVTTANIITSGQVSTPGGTIHSRQAALAGTANVVSRGEIPGVTFFPTRTEALARANVVIPWTGTRTAQYKIVSPPADTTYDLRGATHLGYPFSSAFPINLGGVYGSTTGGPRTVVVGGTVIGQQDRDLTWAQVHDVYGGTGLCLNGTEYIVTYDFRCDNMNDGILIAAPPDANACEYLIEGAYMTWVRDDAIESDDEMSGTIRDCLVDGYSNALSLNQAQSNINAVHTIEDCIFVSAIMNNDHAADGAGHQVLFKTNPAGRCNLTNVTIGMYENPISPGRIMYRGGTGGVWSNVVYVLGPGWVGADPQVPSGATVSRDWQGKIVNAAAAWKSNHGY